MTHHTNSCVTILNSNEINYSKLKLYITKISS